MWERAALNVEVGERREARYCASACVREFGEFYHKDAKTQSCEAGREGRGGLGERREDRSHWSGVHQGCNCWGSKVSLSQKARGCPCWSR